MKIILFLTGPSCVGKSTIMEGLKKQIPNNYLVSYDKLKLQLTGYDREEHRYVMRRLTLKYLEAICEENFFIFVELWYLSEDDVLEIREIADRHNYKLVTAHITAPIDILMKRCRERIATAEKEGRKNSIMDENIYKKSYELKEYLPKSKMTIDTSISTPEEAIKLVSGLLNVK